MEEAKRLMVIGDSIPPTLYDNTVLRKAKEEKLNKRLNLNLQMAKYSTLLRTIHSIGLDPFYCIYWTREQHLLYKLAHKDTDNFIAIDATGSIAKKVRLPNDRKSSHIFLYQCVSVSSRGNFPVFQMISSKHDAAIITYFLLEIVRAGAPLPKMIVSDFGRAILIAVARAFSNCGDLHSYLRICYDIVVLGKTDKVPACYIRLDVSHFIAMIARWKPLKGKPTKVRQFFLRSLGCVYKTTDFQVILYKF